MTENAPQGGWETGELYSLWPFLTGKLDNQVFLSVSPKLVQKPGIQTKPHIQYLEDQRKSFFSCRVNSRTSRAMIPDRSLCAARTLDHSLIHLCPTLT